MIKDMNDEDLLIEALECIYEIRGAYINSEFPNYPSHREDIAELEHVVNMLEKRLGRV